MNRYYTVMVIPEKDRTIVSFKLPHYLFKSLSLIAAILILMLGILIYDYKNILDQVHENNHLVIENRKLRDQLNIFQIKINTLTSDLQRIYTFEKKLRIITGLDEMNEESSPVQQNSGPSPQNATSLNFDSNIMNQKTEFLQLKNLYHQSINQDFGYSSKAYNYTKIWSEISKRSGLLAYEFASFDFKYAQLQSVIKKLEIDVHEIDQFILDKESILRSTPTILPTKGWITSYYGPRTSPYSGRMKMHEGLDIGAQIGTNILAPADGIITYSGHKAGFGNFVQIDHGYGIETIFGHAKSLHAHHGEKIKRGHLIAKVGNTGISTGPHLHYEVRVNGIAVDPFYFILD